MRPPAVRADRHPWRPRARRCGIAWPPRLGLSVAASPSGKLRHGPAHGCHVPPAPAIATKRCWHREGVNPYCLSRTGGGGGDTVPPKARASPSGRRSTTRRTRASGASSPFSFSPSPGALLASSTSRGTDPNISTRVAAERFLLLLLFLFIFFPTFLVAARRRRRGRRRIVVAARHESHDASM